MTIKNDDSTRSVESENASSPQHAPTVRVPFAHTPGPWRAGFWSGRCLIEHQHGRGACHYTHQFFPMNEDGTLVGIAADEPGVNIVTGYDDIRIRLADAVLMAAAPDLLSAAHAALSYVVAHGILTPGTEASGLQRSLRAAIAKAEGR